MLEDLGRALLFYCFALLNPILSAQLSHPTFRHYTTADGLPSSECYDILQDRQGYIWISTDNGVSRFNGYGFENFGPEQGLINNVVFNMQEDGQGRIWFSTLSKNIYYYDYRYQKIEAYAHNVVLEQHKHLYQLISGFDIDHEGTLYAELYGLGIIKILKDGVYELFGSDIPCSKFIYLPLGTDIQVSRSNCSLDDIKSEQQIDTLSLYWKNEHGEKNLKIKGVPRMSSYLEGHRSKDEVFFYWANHLYYFKNDSFKSQHQVPYLVNCVYQHNSDEEIYLGLNEKEGFVKYKSTTDLLEDRRAGHFLKGYSISHIIKDRVGGLWISTLEDGIFYAPNPAVLCYDESSNLSSSNITALSLNKEKEVYLGLKNGGVYALNPRTGSLNKYPKLPTDKEIYELYYHNSRHTLFKGALNFDYWTKKKWSPTSIIRKDGTVEYSSTRKVSRARDSSKLWVAFTGSSGIGRLDMRTMKFDFQTLSSYVIQDRVYDVCEDYNRRVWIGKPDGLYEFIERDSSLRMERAHPHFAARVEAIQQMKDSSIVVGTKGQGVIIWKDDQFIQVRKRDGLTSSMIENLHIDGQQNIWVGTLNGLNRLTLLPSRQYHIKTYTIADGLPSNEINATASYQNSIWVATSGGLVQLPTNMPKNAKTPKPIIEQLLVNGQTISLDSTPIFRYDQNNLVVSLLTLNYKLEGEINYRYRLHPADQWGYSPSRVINMAELSPNEYQLEVQSENEDQQWSNSTTLDFEIAEPFWRSVYFTLGLSLISLGGIYFFYQRRIRQLKEGARLQRKEADRQQERARMERELKDLEDAAMRAQMNPHFLANCLNSIQNFIVQDDSINAMRYLSDFNQLLRRTLDISHRSLVPLEEDINLLKNYLQLEQMRFDQKFEYLITIDELIDTTQTLIPPMLIQPFVENAILHAFPESIKNARIEIHYAQKTNLLSVSVLDNGVGITKSQTKKSTQIKQGRRSYGMGLPRKRLELIGEIGNRVEVEELKNDFGQICGTKVQIHVCTNRNINN